MGQGTLERENSFDPLADYAEVIDDAETHAVAENGAERTPRRCDARLGVVLGIEECSVNSLDPAAVIGDGGDERREASWRRVGITVEQRRMIAQRRAMKIGGDFSRAQIGFGWRAGDRF